MKVNSILFVVVILVVVIAAGCVGEEIGEDVGNDAEITDYNWSAPGFDTDFSRMIIDPAEILSGGPPKDGIPAIDNPQYQSIEDAESWLVDREPVILVRVGETSRIYPLQILTWHEIINDEINGTPLAVTFCPLCNTGIVFRRQVDDRILDFGTTGRLRNSNLIMYDRQTETWWQQATGNAVIGELVGERLSIHPSLTLSFGDVRTIDPDADVVSRETGYSRPYGRNPYANYDTPGNRPFLFSGEVDPALDAMERVLVLQHGGEELVVTYESVRERGVLSADMAGDTIILFWSAGTASALDDADISEGRDVGSLNGFLAMVGDAVLDFESLGDGRFTDIQTGSIWNSGGRALEGDYAGERLVPVTGIRHFWFSARAFSDGELVQ
ncbi:MAG: DUF3179 domain-containing protein [Spirochaetaceae bacterium]|nr:DUF3179 domain-containing protein [Spirochaetaceae bacterium]